MMPRVSHLEMMPMTTKHSRLFAAVCAAGVLGFAGTAAAECTKLAFSVNDYGKKGPAEDAQKLLDGYVARWTKERGIKKYNTGPKTVNCELFLDVGLFDEYTCKAEANVCWEGKPQLKDITAATPKK
jgi:hypothetical protein